MASGLPIVASGVGGILELVDHGRTGLLSPAGDADALANRMLTLMTNPSLAYLLGSAAREEAVKRYSFDRMVASFDALYTSELTRRGCLAAASPQLATS